MNSTVIANVSNRNVYYLSGSNLSFYINMPNESIKNVNIAINLLDRMDSINLGVSNSEKVKIEIEKIYSSFDNSDVVFITPVLDSNICEQLKLSNNEKIFVYTDKYISFLINQVYNLLAEGGITVNSVIKLNNNATYKVFNEWFINKYKGRVELVNFVKAGVPNGLNPFDNNVSKVELTQDMSIANQVLDNTNNIDTIKDDSSVSSDNVREPGFVSYVLLGVIVVVVSLVILYTLL